MATLTSHVIIKIPKIATNTAIVKSSQSIRVILPRFRT